MKKTSNKTSSNVNIRVKPKAIHPWLSIIKDGEDLSRHTEVGIGSDTHRLNLALKLADSVECLSKVSLKLCDMLSRSHNK